MRHPGSRERRKESSTPRIAWLGRPLRIGKVHQMITQTRGFRPMRPRAPARKCSDSRALTHSRTHAVRHFSGSVLLSLRSPQAAQTKYFERIVPSGLRYRPLCRIKSPPSNTPGPDSSALRRRPYIYIRGQHPHLQETGTSHWTGKCTASVRQTTPIVYLYPGPLHNSCLVGLSGYECWTGWVPFL